MCILSEKRSVGTSVERYKSLNVESKTKGVRRVMYRENRLVRVDVGRSTKWAFSIRPPRPASCHNEWLIYDWREQEHFNAKG